MWPEVTVDSDTPGIVGAAVVMDEVASEVVEVLVRSM